MKASSSPVRRGKILKAGAFKASALAVMRRVHETGEGVIVTSRGRPLVRIEPVGEENLSRGYGCMKKAMDFLGPDEDLVAPQATGAWETLAAFNAHPSAAMTASDVVTVAGRAKTFSTSTR